MERRARGSSNVRCLRHRVNEPSIKDMIYVLTQWTVQNWSEKVCWLGRQILYHNNLRRSERLQPPFPADYDENTIGTGTRLSEAHRNNNPNNLKGISDEREKIRQRGKSDRTIHPGWRPTYDRHSNGATCLSTGGILASKVASSRLSTIVAGRPSSRLAFVASGSNVCRRLKVRDLFAVYVVPGGREQYIQRRLRKWKTLPLTPMVSQMV